MIGLEVDWNTFKSFISSRGLSIQYVDYNDHYYMSGIDGHFNLKCIIYKSGGSDQLDFENNFKDIGNKSPNAMVTTQFELDDKDLKVICKEADVDTNTGIATIEVTVPGTFNGLDKKIHNGRWLGGGTVFFTTANVADKVTKIEVVDAQGYLYNIPGLVIKTYHDDDANIDEQGWYIPHGYGDQSLLAETLGGYGWMPSEFVLRLVGKKSTGNYSGKFFCNVFWGKKG